MGIERPSGPYALEMTAGAAWPFADEDSYHQRAEELGTTLKAMTGAREEWEHHRAALFGAPAVWSGRAADAAAAEVDNRTKAMRDQEGHLRIAIDQARRTSSTIAGAKEQVSSNVKLSQSIIARVAGLDSDEFDGFIEQVVLSTYANNVDVIAGAAARLQGPSGLIPDLPDKKLNALGDVKAAPPNLTESIPPSGTTPAEVTRWWKSLSRQQQDELLRTHPDKLCNLDGIPAATREKLNKDRLPGEITKAQAELERVKAAPLSEFSNGPIGGRGEIMAAERRRREAVQGATNKVNDLKQLQDTMSKHGELGLLLLDTESNPRTVLAAVAVGDVDNAKQVGVTVGGMNTNVRSSVDEMAREAITQRNKAIDLRELAIKGDPALAAGLGDPTSVATIGWIGYETPGLDLEITGDALARTGAGPLNSFYNGLAATTNVPDQQITAFGHSYGSLTTSLALQQGAPVDSVVLYGSPGAEITNAAQLGVPAGHAFFMDGVNDGVPTTVAAVSPFGPPLSEVPGMTELSVNSGTGFDGQWHERAYGHSEYARDGDNGQLRMSGYNMAAVLAGLPDWKITPPTDLPPATVPGPHGIPVPNPNYHP